MFIHTVRCPHCGYEYSISELFVANTILERPYFIKRDTQGVISGALGLDAGLEEDYICDNCNNAFRTKLKIDAETVKLNKFTDVSTITIRK